VTVRQHYQVSAEIEFGRVEGEVIILDLRTATFHGLDAVGSLIWETLAETGSLEQAVDRVLEEYEVGREVGERDASLLVGRWLDSGFIGVSDKHASRDVFDG